MTTKLYGGDKRLYTAAEARRIDIERGGEGKLWMCGCCHKITLGCPKECKKCEWTAFYDALWVTGSWWDLIKTIARGEGR